MQKKKLVTISALIIGVIVLLLFLLPVKLTYSLLSEAEIVGSYEWEFCRTLEGNLVRIDRDNEKGIVKSYGVTEFQRGDVVLFEVNPLVINKDFINKGDTIGFFYSNEEQRKLLELENNLAVLQSEFIFYTTGQKPEDVERAKQQLLLAKQELLTQQKLMQRSQVLIKDSVISLQQYDIDLNELKVKELALSIAEANLASISTGDKPEQALLIDAKMEAVQNQILQIRERIGYFTLIAPSDGFIVKERTATSANLNYERLIKVVSKSKMIAIAPVRLFEADFFGLNDSISLPNFNIKGRIIAKDNVANYQLNTNGVYYVAATLDSSVGMFHGMKTPIKLFGRSLLLRDYFYVLLTQK